MLFYDFEVFKYDWLVVVLDMQNRNEHVIVNDPEGLEALYETNKNEIWAGFNNRHYDQYILKGILCGFDPKKINDFIIKKGQPGWKYSSMLGKVYLLNYDVMLNTDRGLKAFEGFMGHSIKESDVPFEIDRKLTEAEIQDVVNYCRNDVQETIEIFLQRIDEFNTMMYFIKRFNLPISSISKTKAQLAAEILGGNRKGETFDDEFEFPLVDCLDIRKYKSIAEWYKNTENHDYKKKQDEVIVAGVPHNFAWGGGHGALLKYHSKGAFLIVDVTAYYPSEQKEFHFGYRVMDHPENFEFIHDSNIEFKRKGDKKARQPFKIMDNAISGQMKQKGSALYDPMSNNSICINGQMMLLDLVEHIEPYSKTIRLIQNNTDGLVYELLDYENDFDIIDRIVSEWEKRTGMKMDFETFFGEIFQKDVNNYLIVDRETGAYKCKGAYVKKLSALDYDLPIVNKALVEYMLNGVPVQQTIEQCDELKEFQLVSKISNKYRCILHGDREIKEKCVRIFASKKETDPGVFKVSIRRGKPEKIANSPEHCFFFNESVNGVKCPTDLNKQWYVELAEKRLQDFGV